MPLRVRSAVLQADMLIWISGRSSPGSLRRKAPANRPVVAMYPLRVNKALSAPASNRRGRLSRQIVQADRFVNRQRRVDVEMVVQLGADPGHVAHHRNAHVLKQSAGPQPRQLQQMRRAVGAAGDDHLAARARGAQSLRRAVFDADGAAVLDQHARGMCVR